MSKRSYNQYCGVARALDVVGERWTLLLVRDLSTGPKRYTDLLEGLGGIGTNLLAARLKDLEAQGIVCRTTLPPPAGSSVYELSELGRSLEPVIVALCRWGLHFLDAPRREVESRPGWAIIALQASLECEATSSIRETYEFRIDGEVFHVRVVEEGRVESRQGQAVDPDLTMTGDAQTFIAVAAGRLPVLEAVDSGIIRVEGTQNILERCARMIGASLTG